MKKSKLLIIVFMLAFALAMPTMVFANYAEESYKDDHLVESVEVALERPEAENGVQNMMVISTFGEPADMSELIDEISRTIDGSDTVYVRLRAFAEIHGARAINWDPQRRAALITLANGAVHSVVVEEVGGFVEDGRSWIPMEIADELAQIINEAWYTSAPRVDRIDLTLWERERFEDVRDTTFSTELPHGQISVNYIEYMSDNLCARSPFTYRELETATWIVEELLAMGHDWDNIAAQEFTYWDVLEAEVGMFSLNWWSVMSQGMLGVDRDYQLRKDRVSQNVILTIPGQSERKIIVGAHYDSPAVPGASDNASGTALLLESAQRMLDMDNYHTIVYVFFGAEEVGLIGAYWYYEMLTEAQRENIVMMINADVLIEGPYIIYGATGAPEIDEADIPYIIDAIFEGMVENLTEMVNEWVNDDDMAMTIVIADKTLDEWLSDEDMTVEGLVDMMTEGSREHLKTLSSAQLAMQASFMGLIDATLNEEVQQINSIAAELNRTYDLGILSIADATMVSSDQLVFLFEGHTVVQFVGLERMGNLEAVLGEFYDSVFAWPMFGEFTTTILHTQLDEFNTIESIWPGMMLNNMRAFSKLLEGILTERFY